MSEIRKHWKKRKDELEFALKNNKENEKYERDKIKDYTTRQQIKIKTLLAQRKRILQQLREVKSKLRRR